MRKFRGGKCENFANKNTKEKLLIIIQGVPINEFDIIFKNNSLI